MDFLSIIDTLTLYGVDIAAISVITCVIVEVLKRTLLKNFPKKVITFLPFITGTLLYAVYAAIANLDFCFVLEQLPFVCERGFTIGALSTVIYVCYEQLIRERPQTTATEGVIAALIEGYVPQDSVQATAKEIAEAISADLSGEGESLCAQILSRVTEGSASADEVQALSRVIIDALKRIAANSAQ